MGKTVNIPLLCGNCGKIYPSPFMVDERIQNFTTTGLKYPCPQCGSPGALRQDLIPFVESSISALKNLPIESLTSLQKTLQGVYTPNITIPQFHLIQNEVTEKIPELKRFKDLMPKTRMEAYTVIGILVTVVLFITNALISGNQVDNKKLLQQVIPQPKKSFINKILPKSKKEDTTFKLIVKKPQSLNTPCPCGSGKKFKRCHGLNSP